MNTMKQQEITFGLKEIRTIYIRFNDCVNLPLEWEHVLIIKQDEGIQFIYKAEYLGKNEIDLLRSLERLGFKSFSTILTKLKEIGSRIDLLDLSNDSQDESIGTHELYLESTDLENLCQANPFIYDQPSAVA